LLNLNRESSRYSVTTHPARLSEDVAMMVDLYAEDQQWSANTAMDTALRRYLEGLGYKERVAAMLKEQE